jgi:hypothetical protein
MRLHELWCWLGQAFLKVLDSLFTPQREQSLSSVYLAEKCDDKQSNLTSVKHSCESQFQLLRVMMELTSDDLK